jgi:uncharacterized protein YkwD
MTTGTPAADEVRWDELDRTASAVRAGLDRPLCEPRSWRRIASMATYLVVLSGVTIAALHAAATATPVRADGGADADLFSLTNQDRASNGVRSLSFSGTLQTIGEGGRYNGCAVPINGRSVDMIQRNYFAHIIPNCGGKYVWSIMQAYGIRYISAGENIGWNTAGGGAAAASYVNSQFMNSPDHRSNILDSAYTALGVGSDNSGSKAWSGGGGSYTGAWMFAEEFIQQRSYSPPPPPPPPPRPRASGSTPTRNSAAPAPPARPPARATAVPTPAPTPTRRPRPTATPGPTPLPILTLPPLLEQPGGLLFNSVESVLESYLID